jgi:hypothetical protein
MILPGGIIGGLKQEIVFKETLSGGASTAHTFTSRDFGAERLSRFILVAAWRNQGQSCTIGGAAATAYQAGFNASIAFYVGQPSGTSGTIALSHSVLQRCSAAFWVVYGYRSTAIGSNFNNDVTSPFATSVTVSQQPRGSMFAMLLSNSSAAHALSGIPTDASATLNGVDFIDVGSDKTTASGTRTVTADGPWLGAISFAPYP